MLRFPINKLRSSSSILSPAKNGKILIARNKSTSSKGSGRLILGLTGVAVAATTGGLVYAKYDANFRNLIIENIPQTKWLFENILSEDSKNTSTPVKKTEEIYTIPKRKVNTELNPSVNKTEIQSTAKSPKVESPPLPPLTPPKTSSPNTIEAKIPQKDEHKATTEHESSRKNYRLTEDLKKNVEQLEKEIKETLYAESNLVELSKDYSNNLTKLLDSDEIDDSNAWNNLNSLKEQKQSALSKANKKISDTRLQIENIQEMIKKAKNDKDLTKNTSILAAEEVMIRCLFQLDKSEKSLFTSEKLYNVSENYRKSFNTAIEELEKELKIITSDGNLKKKPTEEEVNLLVNHSHKKIKQLYRNLAKLEATEKLRIDDAVNLQKEEDYRVIDTKIALELAKRKSELEREYQNKVNGVKQDLENELKVQLKRQLAAYQDHLREQLQVQKMEVVRGYMITKEQELFMEKAKYFQKLELTLSRLSEIENIMKSREQLDKDQMKASQLWLFSQKLLDTLKLRNQNTPKILKSEIEQVKQTAESIELKSNLTNKIIDSLPKTVIDDGVYTEDDIIDRFTKVKQICRRVALVGDEGGSLFKYMLSYLQSSMLFERKRDFSDEISNVEKWDTFEILDRVNYSLSKRDLEASLRYANQLKGKARQVASDWIQDLRTHLELRQSVEILQAQAVALTLRAVR